MAMEFYVVITTGPNPVPLSGAQQKQHAEGIATRINRDARQELAAAFGPIPCNPKYARGAEDQTAYRQIYAAAVAAASVAA